MANKASTVNAAIQAALGNIDGTGSYVTTLVDVYREFEAPQPKDDSTAFPYVTYGATAIEEEPWDANGTTKKVEALIELRLYVAWPDGDPEDAITELYYDVKLALEADHTLGGVLFNSHVGALQLAEMKRDFGFVSGVVRFEVKYTHTIGART